MSEASGSSRMAQLEKQRKTMLASFESQKTALLTETARNRTSSDRFTAKTDGVDDALKRSTYGLVQLSDFKETREKLERDAAGGTLSVEKKKGKKKKLEGKVKLSFAMEEEEDSLETVKKVISAAEIDEERPNKKAKLGKNPYIDTHFLPDVERDKMELAQRESLKNEWLLLQEATKEEEVEVTYSYWDGKGSRMVVMCKKGDTIAMFLEKCRLQFPELRAVSVDNLMYIKEDLILPHHMTFYDCIINKYRGKSGPLFNFDVHDDVRLLADATIEKDESHAGKVVERSWYNRSKHIFPASRWEVFNPEVTREKYTIH